MSTTLSGTGLLNLTVPSPGLDTDVWDTVLNDDSLTQIARALYAAREDRNLSILGGGKISWNSSTNQVAFTEDIIIRDHVTDKTVTITTAASPVTLSAANTVGYIQKNREPASNQSITSVSTAVAGALPDAVSDNGNIVLFHRTTDGTLLIPCARREVLNGDHWQFGAMLSWFEKLASNRKPNFKANTADTSQVKVPGSSTIPAVVFINGKLYANVADATMDLDTAGRNGLDTGAKAATTIYYLYAITPTSGRTFDVVASVTAPTTGPTGFSAWSYIGAFQTIAASAVPQFVSADGRFLTHAELDIQNHTGNTTLTSKTIRVPATTKNAIGELIYSGAIAAGAFGNVAGSNDANSLMQAILQANGIQINYWWEVSLDVAGTIWLKTSNSSGTVYFRLFGWQESPMEYQ